MENLQFATLGILELEKNNLPTNETTQEFLDEMTLSPDDAVEWFNKLQIYDDNLYSSDVKQYGLEKTWDCICKFLLNDKHVCSGFLYKKNLSELYEEGLAIQDKQNKKESGQYYTPDDVCGIMSKWLQDIEGYNVCDVACGTGNLILNYLELIGRETALELLNAGRIYLYDIDQVALNVCKTTLLLKYGKNLENKIHIIEGDFLNSNIHLPNDCKAISNPPYATIKQFGDDWECSEIQKESKELYSAFMEKIIKESRASVIITPYSFVGSNKFFALRQFLNNYNGFIVSFDNVPGNIFRGLKQGVFNSNTSNSVRAAITVVKNDELEKGFRISPLIRFKTTERNKLLINAVLENYLPQKRQIVSDVSPNYIKCFKELISIYENWIEKSEITLEDCCSAKPTKNIIYFPNTCRYFTTGAFNKLDRKGVIKLYIKEKKYFGFIYCLINSSFAYWWWRIFDGGITYPVGLLKALPIFTNLLSETDYRYFNKVSREMIKVEKNYVTKKLNAGDVQENIKFPRKYRDRINKKILKILNIDVDKKIFDLIHKNNAFGKIEDEG